MISAALLITDEKKYNGIYYKLINIINELMKERMNEWSILINNTTDLFFTREVHHTQYTQKENDKAKVYLLIT